MVVEILKYMGPFLRINTLDRENIEKQLLFFSRESFKHIILNSKCGITTTTHHFRTKNIPNFDINIFKKNSPLLCIYKKANPKLTQDKDYSGWDETTFKKDLPISSNAYMNLMLLELSKYYEQFDEIDNKLFSLGKFYAQLSVKQLDFFSSSLRNNEGVFIDKKDNSDAVSGEVNFEDKEKKFKFSDQALLMGAYYKASLLADNADGEAYKSFSLDILNMFLHFREELYDLSFEEINKLTFAFNVFFEESKNDEAKYILIDLCDLLLQKYKERDPADFSDKLEALTMLYINLHLAHGNLGIEKFKLENETIFNTLNSLYDVERGIFLKNIDKKEVDYSCQEIVLYTLSQLINLKQNPDLSASTLIDVYKRQFVNSGIVLSWPDTPNLDCAERYRGFSMKSEDLMEDENFRMPSIATPDSAELAPVLIKNVSYNTKKEVFSQGKTTFDSTKNMPLLFMIHYLLLHDN